MVYGVVKQNELPGGNMKNGLNTTYISPSLESKLSEIPDHLVTTIIAAAGYGKTRAVRWWIDENCAKDDIVFSMTVMRDSLSEFWLSFISCFEEWTETYDSLKALGFPSDAGSREVMASIVNDWYSARKNHSVYFVIDDLHFIPNPLISDFLVHIATGAPAIGTRHGGSVHFLLISRNMIFNHAERIKLGSDLNEITMEDLRLDKDGIISYAERSGIKLTDEDAEMLDRTTEGWFSVVYLNLSSYLRNHMWLNGSDSIYSIMDEVLFKPLSDREEDFLVTMGLPDEFSSEEAWWIWQQDDTRDVLRKLSLNNAFIMKLPDGTYRYHSMLKKCAMAKFNNFPEERRNDIYYRLAKWYEKNMRLPLAEHYYYKCKAWDELLDCFVIGQGRTVIGENIERFLAWEKECPRECMLRHPVALLTIMKVLFSFGQIPEMYGIKALLTQSLENSDSIDETEKNNLLGESELIMGFTQYNDIQGMSSFHRRAKELMTRYALNTDSKGSWTFGSPSVLWMYHRTPGGLDSENDAMFECMPYYYSCTNSHGNGAEYSMLSEIDLMRGDIESARQNADIALASSKIKEQLSIRIATEFVLFHIMLMENDMASVRKQIVETRQNVQQERQYNLLYTMDLVEAWIESINRTPKTAASWITDDTARVPLPNLVLPMLSIVRNQVSLAQKDPAAVIARQALAEKFCGMFNALMCRIYLHLQLSAAYEAMGQDKNAENELKTALDLSMPDGIVMPFALFYGRFITRAFDTISGYDEYGVFIAKAVKLSSGVPAKTESAAEENKEKTAGRSGSKIRAKLTDTEFKIAKLASMRKTNKEIAEELFLAEGTVRNRLSSVFVKLGIEGDTRNKRLKLEEYFKD